MCLSNQWGTVSGTNWNDKNTQVVCRQLNATFSGECYIRARVLLSNGAGEWIWSGCSSYVQLCASVRFSGNVRSREWWHIVV